MVDYNHNYLYFPCSIAFFKNDTICLYTAIYQVFLCNTNNFQTDLFDLTSTTTPGQSKPMRNVNEELTPKPP